MKGRKFSLSFNGENEASCLRVFTFTTKNWEISRIYLWKEILILNTESIFHNHVILLLSFPNTFINLNLFLSGIVCLVLNSTKTILSSTRYLNTKQKIISDLWMFFMTTLKKTFPKELLKENTFFNSKVLKCELFNFSAFLSDINHFPRTLEWVGSQNFHPSCCHFEMANKQKWEMSCKCLPRKKYI